MFKLRNKSTQKQLHIPDDIKDVFSNQRLVFNTMTPETIALATYFVVDFDNEQLIEFDCQNDHNMNLFKQRNVSLDSPCHSIIPYRNGFYVFSTNIATDYFRYIDLVTQQTTIFTIDDFSLPNIVNIKSSGYQNLNNDNLIIAFSTTDNNTTIVECDHDMNVVNELALLHRDNLFIHDMVLLDQTLLLSNFEFFTVLDRKDQVICNSSHEFRILVDEGYVPGKDVRYKQNYGELHEINTSTNNHSIHQTLIGPTAHFVVNGNDIFLTMHNATVVNGAYYYMGPAGISKWTLTNNELVHIEDFTDKTYYRTPLPVLYHNNGETYLMAFSHPNRLFSIHTNPMSTHFTCDIDEPYNVQLINTKDKIEIQERYCYNDISVSNNGKYVCLFESNRIQFFNTETKTTDFVIDFPKDVSSEKRDYFRRINHTCLINIE